jgi:hypothetical protein
MDYREKFKKRVEQEEEQSKINRDKRNRKKAYENQKIKAESKKLKNHSTGLITWVQKGELPQWNGYINEGICFKISQGIYKYSLSVYVDTGDKKDKNLKTSFELDKLQIIAEKIAVKIPPKIEENK